MNNWLGLVISFLYIFTLIGIAEGLRRWLNYSSGFTRKLIHIGVGMLIWAAPFLFDNRWYFIAACSAFVIINYLDWRYGFFASMMSSERANLGTVYFPLATGVVTYLFWAQPPLMVAALMPLTWGDGIAPIVGQKYGRHTYQIYTSQRSIEGSLGFLVAATLFTWLGLWLMPGFPNLTAGQAILPAIIVAIITMFVEAISIWGIDNLTITAYAIFFFLLWPFS